MMGRNLCLFGAIFVLSLVVVACSKKEEDPSVRLQFPDWQAMRKADLERQGKVSSLAFDAGNIEKISINITGNGIKDPIFSTWDRKSASDTPPLEASFDLPRGSAPLVQVMAMFSGDTGAVFYYDDDTPSLKSDGSATSVNIELANIASSSAMIEGTIVGRILDADGSGPSGEFEYRLTPEGKPSMLVHKGEIFGGWVHLYALNSSLLSYYRATGAPLLAGMHNSSDVFYSASQPQKALRIAIPAGYEERNGGSTMMATGAKRVVVGFFGPGSRSQKVCYDGSTERNIQSLYVDAAKSAQVKWDGTISAAVANRAYVEPVTPAGGGTAVRGGSSAATCSTEVAGSNEEWKNFVKLNTQYLDGGHGALNFSGPFKIPSGANGFLKTQYDSSTQKLNVSWSVLPGADADISDWGVFYRTLASSAASVSDSDLRASDGYLCNDLKSLSSPFSEIKVAQATTTVDIPGIASTNVANVQIVVCPYSQNLGRYYTSAVTNRSYGGGNDGGSTVQETATQLAITGPTGNSGTINLFAGNCSPISIEGRTSSGQVGFIPAGTIINLSSAVSLYGSEYCSSGYAISSLTSYGGSYFRVFVKSSTSSADSIAIAASSALNSSTVSASASLQFAESIAATRLKISAPAQINAHECYAMDLQSVYENGSSVIPSRFIPGQTVALPEVANLEFFYSGTGSMCSGTAITSVSIGGSADYEPTTKSVYFRYRGSASSISMNFAATSPGNFPAGSQTISVTQPGAAVQLRLAIPTSIGQTQCVPVTLQSVDSSGRLAPVSAQTVIRLATNVGAFYENSYCGGNSGTGSTLTSVTMASTGASRQIYFKSEAQASGTVGASVDSGSSLTAYSAPVVVGPPAFETMIVALPGQTFQDGSGIVGTPAPMYAGETYTALVYAVSWTGHLASATNSAISNITVNGTGSTTPATATFVNGVASIGFSPGVGATSISTNSVQGYGGTASGYASFALTPKASQFGIYFPSTSLASGVCQLFTIVPEDSDGSAGLAHATTVSLVADHGGLIYDNPGCTDTGTASKTVSVASSEKILVRFYKNTTVGSSQVQATASGFTTFIAGFNVGSGSLGSPYKYAVVGRSASFSATRCQPYIISLVDSLNQFVKHTSDVTMYPTVGSGGGTAGIFFDNPLCSTPYIYGAVTLPSVSGYQVVYFGWGVQGSTNVLGVSGSPYQSGDKSVQTY